MKLFASQPVLLSTSGADDLLAKLDGAVGFELVLVALEPAELPPEYRAGAIVTLTFSDGARRRRAVTTICRSIHTSPAAVVVTMPRSFEPIQEREMFRVAMNLGSVVEVLDSANPLLRERIDATAFTEDLSGGGVRLNLAVPIQVGDRLRVRLELAPGAVADVQGSVRHVRKADQRLTMRPGIERTESRWVAGVRFDRLGERVQARILRTLFDFQRKLRA